MAWLWLKTLRSHLHLLRATVQDHKHHQAKCGVWLVPGSGEAWSSQGQGQDEHRMNRDLCCVTRGKAFQLPLLSLPRLQGGPHHKAREGFKRMHRASCGVSVHRWCRWDWKQEGAVRKGSARGHFPGLRFGPLHNPCPAIKEESAAVHLSKGSWHLAGARR